MVLDSKALLILLRGEPNHERVARALDQPCCITTISLAVLIAELSGVSPRALTDDLTRLGVEVVAVDSSLTTDAAKLIAASIPLEATFTLSLALQRGSEALLGERVENMPSDWKQKINTVR
jgi:PIN domain nuclease of toxin-antitoxin system